MATPASFYEPADPRAVAATVDRDVYNSLYQREKDACLERLLQAVPLRGCRTLEVGCGAGVWTERLARAGASVTAIDPRPHLVAAARDRVARSGLDASCAWLVGTIDAVIHARPFALVVAKDVIEHVRDDAAFVAGLVRCMAPDGWLLLSTHNARSANFALEAFWERIVKRRRNWMGWDPTHVRFYTPRRLRALLSANGLHVVHRNGAYYLPYRWFAHRVGRPDWEPAWAHAADRHSDDNGLADWGWSMHLLARRSSP